MRGDEKCNVFAYASQLKLVWKQRRWLVGA